MAKLIDLKDQVFGNLTVIEKDQNRISNSGSYWICKCKCGNIKSVKSSSLRRGEIQSCGCYRNKKIAETKRNQSENEMLNKKFGKLTVKSRSERKSNDGALYWICECDCGNTIEVLGHSLKRKDGNQTVSCGCYHRSIGVTKILTVLTDNNINFVTEYSFLDLPKSRFDFAIVKNNQIIRLIEFDGEQHFKDVPKWGGLGLQQKRDNIKNEYALTNNIPLVRIPYWEQDNITLGMLIGDKYLVGNKIVFPPNFMT